MILYDGIIFSLQQMGGISVLFNELFKRLPQNSYQLVDYSAKNNCNARVMERYRAFKASVDYSIFHSTYYRLPDVKRGMVVTTVHDYTYERYSSGLRRYVHTNQKNKAILGSDKVVCVSESTKRDLLEYTGHYPEERLVVVHNGVSSDYYSIPGLKAVEQVLFVGARHGYKNFHSLVLALSRLSWLELVCVGGGAFTKDEIDLLERKISGRYRHSGFLNNSQLNTEYNKSLCLVYPSLYEGFGIPILEAMRAGCPVVAVNRSSVPEVAGEAAYLMEQGSPDEIFDAINFFSVFANRNEYIARGLLRARNFSWDLTFDKTIAVYQELLGCKLVEDV
ncbi:glycosyltransferase family 4 protein [Stutzerimonas stutzeri]|uniref:glycosyltransferase family 4 protein n=1 Tax=Stutzerimonas stutzeri TaxID=316 RepID=UPI000F79D88C|nr:glycosyltransferase family 1 protein [Stutzerimonas stutzeri]RSH69856.1 glycosyltransferase family 1 protein [Stutzerimonas stutzeri]